MDPKYKDLYKEYKLFLNAELNVDRDMIKESIRNYITEEVDYNGKKCLDLGSNLGAFSKIAIDGGASSVLAVECDQRNFDKISHNFTDIKEVNAIHAAVSGSTEKTLKIFKSDAKSNHSSTSILKRGYRFNEYDEVKNLNFTELVKENKPDIIKIDIEGAEYQIIDSIIDYNPDVLFIELHGSEIKCADALNELTINYPNNKIDAIHVFQKVGGYDCLFYK